VDEFFFLCDQADALDREEEKQMKAARGRRR